MIKKIKQFVSVLFISFVLIFPFAAGISKVNAADNLSATEIQSIQMIVQSVLQQIQVLVTQLNQLTQQNSQNNQNNQYDWKTYKNSAAGFEIKYPAEFHLVDDSRAGIASKSIKLETGDSALQVIFNPIITGGGCGNADDYTFQTIAYLEDMQQYEKMITIDGRSLKILYNVLNPGYCNDSLAEKCITERRISAYVVPRSAKSHCAEFSANGMKYAINFGGKFGGKSAGEAAQVFEKMISTVKFTVPQGIIGVK